MLIFNLFIHPWARSELLVQTVVVSLPVTSLCLLCYFVCLNRPHFQPFKLVFNYKKCTTWGPIEANYEYIGQVISEESSRSALLVMLCLIRMRTTGNKAVPE